MFRSAALKLTVWYLLIIMAISLVFSSLLYRVSSQELSSNVNRQLGYFNNFLGPNDFNVYRFMRQRQLNSNTDHLRANLIIFNGLVLAVGGAASYWLARRTLQPIEVALNSQSRFAADASHELRTPLTAIQTENEVALRNPNLKKTEAIKLLQSNLEEIAKLKSLSEGLLKLAGGSQPAEFKLLEIKDVLDTAVERIAKTANQKQIKIITQLQSYQIMGEPETLVELFSIILDNAVKYSQRNTRITLSTYPNNKFLSVAVKDQGIGIVSNELPKVFERFYRIDQSRSRNGAGGYGLGLSIAKQLAQAHKGYIEVKSRPGSGSTFTVSLPFIQT